MVPLGFGISFRKPDIYRLTLVDITTHESMKLHGTDTYHMPKRSLEPRVSIPREEHDPPWNIQCFLTPSFIIFFSSSN